MSERVRSRQVRRPAGTASGKAGSRGKNASASTYSGTVRQSRSRADEGSYGENSQAGSYGKYSRAGSYGEYNRAGSYDDRVRRTRARLSEESSMSDNRRERTSSQKERESARGSRARSQEERGAARRRNRAEGREEQGSVRRRQRAGSQEEGESVRKQSGLGRDSDDVPARRRRTRSDSYDESGEERRHRIRSRDTDRPSGRRTARETADEPEEIYKGPKPASGSAIIFTVLKTAALAAIVFFLFTRMSGSRLSTVTFADMQSAVTGAADINTMQQADNQMIKRLYVLDPALFDGISLYYPLTNMGAEELFLVRLRDISQQDEVREAIDNRLSTQKKSFEGYGIEQSAMLNRSVSEVRGNYAIFVSADDTAPMKTAFDKTY